MYAATGARHQQYKVSLWDLKLTKPPSQIYTKFLGMEPTDTGYIHDTHKCMRAFRKPSRFSSSQDIIPHIFIVLQQSQQMSYLHLDCYAGTQCDPQPQWRTLIITCISLSTEVKCETRKGAQMLYAPAGHGKNYFICLIISWGIQ